ncbi:hypothetical protein MIND_01272200 [Mycena indigotica]|uniref:Uncharacterized protein n=1 Tax=Mycena indigotica TaxID=2126181 RepID=A0A8H6VRM7_9AGAR|nr:uncharacterized protein MIND_01272200 [Mycena indigotica]KAF7291284.1 hypothetical protein MIND_01272200 [Mycena indigotica]
MKLAPAFPFLFLPRLDRLTTAFCLLVVLLAVSGRAEVVPLLEPGFFFDYNIPGQSPPVPITEQCETIHIKWGRQGAIGPNPVAPYSMVVYTSTFTTPFTINAGNGLEFDWQVPFAPGTQYQICMWDKNGVPGGCQAMYTMVKNSTVAQPICKNVTLPVQLQVAATDHTGPLSQFGFTDQCTDIKLTPKSGRPPYTLTVAPPLHPPFNITSNSMKTIDWTLSLPWSYPFFLSLQSGDGQLWHFGPLHAGGFGPTDCLAPGTISKSKAATIALGAGLGSAFGAGVFAALTIFLYRRFRPEPHPPIDAFNSNWEAGSRPTSESAFRSRLDSQSAASWATTGDSGPSRVSRGRTYVLHHDAGQAPITVITDAEEVVELPPRYRMDSPAGPNDPSGGYQTRLPMREKAQPPLPPVDEQPVAGPSRLS